MEGYKTDFLGAEYEIGMPVFPAQVLDELVKHEGGRVHILDYYNYSVVMHQQRRLPLLTAANIDGSKFIKISRDRVGGKWKYDNRIPKAYQLGSNLYKADHSDFDRGHMTKREDVQWGDTEEEAKKAAKATFYYTNAVPQHARLNQVAWRKVEDFILHQQAILYDKLICMFTGPLLEKDDPLFVTPVDGGLIQLPCWFWKVVYFTKDDGQLNRVCFLYSQGEVLRKSKIVKLIKSDELSPVRAYFMGFEESHTYQVTTSVIERLTGFDFPEAVDSYQDDSRPLEMIVQAVEVKGDDGVMEKTFLFKNIVL